MAQKRAWEQPVSFSELEINCERRGLVVSGFGGDQSHVKSLLRRNDLILPHSSLILLRPSESTSELNGTWFYISGNEAVRNKDGIYTWNGKGRVIPATGNENFENLVRIFSGDSPPYLWILSDKYARASGARFGIGGDLPPNSIAPLTVGAKINHKAAT